MKVVTGTSGGQAFLEVSDDGVGMPPDVAARAFEPFYRPEGSRARGEGTAGLGLSIAAAIAEAHGGTVELDTAPGQGARFRVCLPLDVPWSPSDPPRTGCREAIPASDGAPEPRAGARATDPETVD